MNRSSTQARACSTEMIQVLVLVVVVVVDVVVISFALPNTGLQHMVAMVLLQLSLKSLQLKL